ncbi:VOC family protein [Actinoallomurus purpureus]|uniref:VOC family protein n=1 Tax=Actinoallomurus purpureus TaxID=478114 RepID=UPI00209308D8|nr:VOC family protein [Actinoallomurus purpureus]MCO6010178.1 VOC family protein [Actinoallomurus purpureus]
MYTVDFVEFPSGSASGSGRFFEEAFGWTTTSYGPDYVDVHGGGVGLGFQADSGEKPTAPLVAIHADDLEAARQAIEAAGGVVTVEPFDFPGGRRFHFREPGGCELAVWCPTGEPTR